jgi:putative endonuclease
MRAVGAEIESRAAAWLSARAGWRLLERNYLCRMGELDLVFEDSSRGTVELVFVEVRSRGEGSWVGAFESVDGRKRRRLERAARRYLLDYRGPARGVRFDVLGWDGREWAHVENAWVA